MKECRRRECLVHLSGLCLQNRRKFASVQIMRQLQISLCVKPLVHETEKKEKTCNRAVEIILLFDMGHDLECTMRKLFITYKTQQNRSQKNILKGNLELRISFLSYFRFDFY